MSNQARAIFLFLTIVAVLFVSAFGTTSVYADDGTLPPPETGEVEMSNGEGETDVTEPPDADLPDTGSAPSEEAPVEPEAETVVEETPAETAPEEAPVVEEQAPAEPEVETVVEETPAETAPAEVVAETILEQVPQNTTVTVLDAEGEAQPLVSQESVEAILASDPIWCPEGQSPTPGLNGCTQSYGSFTELLSFLLGNEGNAAYQQAGTIYVQKDAYTGGESSIDFNAYNFQNINNYNLTVQGGWDTVDNSLEPTDTSQFDIPIIIGSSTNPWVGSLTFNNISISGVYNQAGLTLFSQGTIVLSNVDVTASQSGADLNAGGAVIVQDSSFNNNKKSGAAINAGGTVSVTNSEFNNNASSKDDGFGLQVDSLSNVFLSQVTARENEKFGADIQATGPVVVLNSVFSGNVSYSSSCSHKTANGGYGLNVVTTGPIVLDGVTANDNYLFGAHLEGAQVNAFNSFFNNNGSGSIDKPKGYGLEVLSTGGATLINVEANNNQLFGANIQATDQVIVNNSFFNGNKSYTSTCSCKTYYGYGLQVVTTGDISLSQVSAVENHLFGAHLEGATVSVGNSTFSNNGSGSSKTLTGKGLEIESTGEVTLASVEASNNQLFGANIQAVGNVTISDGFFNGHEVYTYSCKGKSVTGGGYGLQVASEGRIALFNVEASNNYLYGAQLTGVEVTIDVGSFNENKEGLSIESSGPVTLSAVHADKNKLFGANIEANGMVSVSDSFFNGNKSYTSNCGCKTYYGYGLQVITNDFVLLSNVTANDNYLFGAHLEGAGFSIASSTFNNNGTGYGNQPLGKGLEVVSTGEANTVSLYEVTASNNQLFGANIQADGFVFVNNSVFSGNMSYTSSTCKDKTYYGYGLQVVTTSEVYLGSVTANGNHLFGASLTGSYVEVSNSSFNLNSSGSDKNPTGKGLEVKSTGDVLLKYVEANNNQLFGANVQADGQVNVLSSVFAGNKYYTYTSCKGTKGAGYGLKVVATGPITLGLDPNDPDGIGVEAYDNGAEGAILEGESTVTVSDSLFNDNGANGLSITASGDVTLTNVTANGNGQDGVNVTGICSNTVYVNGGTFKDNDRYGIKVTKATYTPSGVQTFANNRSGNVFQDSGNCFTSGSNNNNSSGNSNTGSHSYGYGQWPWWYWFSRHH